MPIVCSSVERRTGLNSRQTWKRQKRLQRQAAGTPLPLHTRQISDISSRYLVAIHNPRKASLTVYPTPLTPQILSHTVKALKSIPPAPAPTARAFREARNNLGETFGTKKAKAAIRAQERNKVDVGAMEGVMGHVMEGIDKGAENLLTKGTS